MRDRDAVVIGSGPSLIGFDFNNLRQSPFTTFAVKEVGEKLSWADYFFSMDIHASLPRLHLLKDFQGTKVLALKEGYDTSHSIFEDFKTIIKDNLYTTGFSFDPSRVYGRNSGFSAANYAALRGFKNIYLLGIDLRTGGMWHNPYSRKWVDPRYVDGKLQTREQYIKEIIADFQIASDQCEEKGINLISVGGFIPGLQAITISKFQNSLL